MGQLLKPFYSLYFAETCDKAIRITCREKYTEKEGFRGCVTLSAIAIFVPLPFSAPIHEVLRPLSRQMRRISLPSPSEYAEFRFLVYCTVLYS